MVDASSGDGDPLQAAAAALRRAQHSHGTGHHLTALAWTHQAAALLTAARHQLAQRARDQGASWADIGATLGMTRQGAQQTIGGRGGRPTDRGDEHEQQ